MADAETLRFLVNPVYQKRVVADQRQEGTRDRRRKYRKRILALHQSLMKGEAPECGLKAAHDAFVGAAIRYIRLEEERRLMEEELGELDPPPAPGPPRSPPTKDYDMTGETVKALGRERPAPSMDDFVVRTLHTRPLPVPRRRRLRAKKSPPLVDGATKSADKKKRSESKNKDRSASTPGHSPRRIKPSREAADPETEEK